MGRNIQRLGDTLIKRMENTANAAVGLTTELGTINYNMSLSPDSLMGISIPEGDYMIVDGMKLEEGDRVLISWCGNEPVVTGAASTEQQSRDVTVTSDGKGNVTITF